METENKNETNNINKRQDLSLATIAAYWTHRGFVGRQLALKIAETVKRGEIVYDDNDACKVCE